MGFAYLEEPSEASEGKKNFVIVGGGIIGVCTAYYLTRHPLFNPIVHHVLLLEGGEVAGGASGKAGGLVASWAFPDQLSPLGFALHQQLSDVYDGEKNWGYRRLAAISVEADLSRFCDSSRSDEEDDGYMSSSSSSSDSIGSTSHRSNAPNPASVPKDLDWVDTTLVKRCCSLGEKHSTAQVHPYKFTTFILKKAIETGCVDLIRGRVTKINLNESGAASGISYIPIDDKLQPKSTVAKTIYDSEKIILCMGAWITKLLVDCPISGLKAHSIVVNESSVERGSIKNRNEVSAYAIFTELTLSRKNSLSPEIYSRIDNEIYVCGEGDPTTDLPDTVKQVEIEDDKCEELYKCSSKLCPIIEDLKKENNGHIKKNACYLPMLDVSTTSGPLLGETNVPNMLIADGHSCWGISNAPVTGKIVSELLLDGQSVSAGIKKFNPKLYFDASVFK